MTSTDTVSPERQYQDLPLEDLHLDLENPRTGEADDEQEATDLLWEEAEPSICGLGRHISEHGLNNADPLYVIPRTGGGYTVVDGNRRLLALRSLIARYLVGGRGERSRGWASGGWHDVLPLSIE